MGIGTIGTGLGMGHGLSGATTPSGGTRSTGENSVDHDGGLGDDRIHRDLCPGHCLGHPLRQSSTEGSWRLSRYYTRAREGERYKRLHLPFLICSGREGNFGAPSLLLRLPVFCQKDLFLSPFRPAPFCRRIFSLSFVPATASRLQTLDAVEEQPPRNEPVQHLGAFPLAFDERPVGR